MIAYHQTIGKQVGSRCFIIAPRGTFLFQEDYVDFDGVRYYAFRIPYSFINEIHTREFSAMQQPHDEASVNETVEAVGFDFIQPPVVDFAVTYSKDGSAKLKIKDFESRARVRGKNKVGGKETLSMVLIDYDYNGEVFDLDAVHYAHAIKDNDWCLDIPAEQAKKNAMYVFLDMYGNEARILSESPKKSSGVKTPRKHIASKK